MNIRWIFLLASCVTVGCAAFSEPGICGNGAGRIQRYLRREMEDQITLLAVADDGIDRFAVFRSLQSEPDDRWIIRFRQNEDGSYEAYLSPRRMYGPYPVRGIYTQPLRGYSGDREACYAVWNGSERLAEIRFRLDYGPEEAVPLSAPPSLTIWRFTGGEDGWYLESSYLDGAGNDLEVSNMYPTAPTGSGAAGQIPAGPGCR